MANWNDYLAGLGPTRFLEAVRTLFDNEATRVAAPPATKVGVFVAGGAAVHFWTRVGRVTDDVDAEFSQRYLPGEDIVRFQDEAGVARGLYIDRQYNPMFALLHEDYVERAVAAAGALGDNPVFDIHVLAPLDLAISKVGRWSTDDQLDVEALAKAGLLDADELDAKAHEALSTAVGFNVRMVEINIMEAVDCVRRATPRPGV